jgi:hypothetical protein
MCFSTWRGVLSYYTFIASLFTRAINCTKQDDSKSDHCINLLTLCLTFPYRPMMYAERWYKHSLKIRTIFNKTRFNSEHLTIETEFILRAITNLKLVKFGATTCESVSAVNTPISLRPCFQNWFNTEISQADPS